MDTPTNEQKVKTAAAQDIAYAEAAVKRAEADAAAAKSWISANWHYALGIAIASLVLGVIIGAKFA